MNKEIRFPSINPSLKVEQNCSWKILAPIDQSVILTFNIIQMDRSKGCNQSSIQVFDGPNSNGSQIGNKICGSSNLESLESMGRDVYLVYSSVEVNSSDRFTIGVDLPGIQKCEII